MHLLWGECTWEEIAQAAREEYIVILPTGAIEQHGPMLPVDVDARLAERSAIEGAQCPRDQYGPNLLVLPALPYGQSCHHMNFPRTISFHFETYTAALYDILRAAVNWGFRSIGVQNDNGGNEHAIEVARYQLMEELTREGKDARIYVGPGHGDEHVREQRRKLREAGLMPEETLGIHMAA